MAAEIKNARLIGRIAYEYGRIKDFERKLELLARLLEYVRVEDDDLDCEDFSQALADRCKENYEANGF